MWHLFWQNQFYKMLASLIVLLLSSPFIFSQDKPLELPPGALTYPGLFETFETLVKIDGERLKKKATLLIKNNSLTTALDLKAVKLDPDFISSALLHTPQSYLKLVQSNQCRFYDLITTDLLKTAEGAPQRIFVTFTNKSNEESGAIISKKEFLEKIVYPTCEATKNMVAKFQIKNLNQLQQELKIEHPASLEQCDYLYTQWIQDPRSPYYCQMHEIIQSSLQNPNDQNLAIAKILKTKFSENQVEYLNQFCHLLGQKDLFCADFFKSNFWTKANDDTSHDSYLQNLCESNLKKPWSKASKRECLSQIKKDDDFCLFKNPNTSALAPSPRCEQLSTALSYSSLKSNYDDCPRNSDQLSVTNFSRLLLNFSKTPPQKFSGHCSSISAGEVYNFFKLNDSDEFWGTKLCYFDTIDEKEICYPVFMGDYGTSEANLSTVVQKIMNRTKGFSNKDQCRVLKSSEYRKDLLEFKTGCFIVLDQKNCGIGSCPFKVVWNEREIKSIKAITGMAMDYFPNSAATERFSLTYLLNRNETRINRSLTTLASLISFLKNSTKSLAHGIGCAEDLLPTFFKKNSLNQCTPMPFIIDGVIKEGEDVTLVTRSSVDDLQSPRLIPWSIIYSAVKSFQTHHPLKQWTLYGTY